MLRGRKGHGGHTGVSRFGRFQIVSLGGMGINMAILWLLHGALRWPLMSSNLLGITGAVLYNYVTNKLWTWGLGSPGVEPPR